MTNQIKAELWQNYEEMDDVAKSYLILEARTLAATRPAPKVRQPLLRLIPGGVGSFSGGDAQKVVG